MKKNTKKKIVIISAILIINIIVTVITTKIVNNMSIGNKNYESESGNSNSTLIAKYIQKGITLGGITGTLETLDTYDATATPEDISWGKTAYVKGVKITGTKRETVTGDETTNTTIHDEYGNAIIIPAGFKVVNPEANVEDGIVIEDAMKGSQFVWVPVGEVKTNNGETKTITLGRYTFDSNGKEQLKQSAENWNLYTSIDINGYSYKELSSSNYDNTIAKNLQDFITKTLSSGGYYIGRYEAGDVTAITDERTDDTSDGHQVVCKEGVYPYNYVLQPQAATLAREMYSSTNFESDLINSYAWDTAIVFIQTFSGDSNYSIQVGKNTTNNLQRTGENTLANVDSGNNPVDVRCNIYDMAGNVDEWTTETADPTNHSVRRGGNYSGTNTSSRAYHFTSLGSNRTEGFRTILYL